MAGCAGWKLVESLFSMLANSIVGIFVALYDGVARAKAAVEKGFEWLREKFGWIVALIMSLFLEVHPYALTVPIDCTHTH